MKIYGNVQGVGFRYRARQAADHLGITGWVANEWDGTVTMEVQGTPEQFERMMLMISKGTFVRIEGVEEQDIPVKEEERNFRVRGY